MGRRIGQGSRAIAAARQHAAVDDHHSPDRHLATRGRRLGFGQRRQHIALRGTSCHKDSIRFRKPAPTLHA